ncbi:MAG TPA: hypothetical protein VN369_00840 [Terriglobales bacterium]|nr:hypothetical protein [Terriglobales bacterium]
MKLYGSHLCPDTLYALNVLVSKGVDFSFYNISADLAHLKAFLKLRESCPLYDAVRARDGIGIPCFVKDDGEVTLNLDDVL